MFCEHCAWKQLVKMKWRNSKSLRKWNINLQQLPNNIFLKSFFLDPFYVTIIHQGSTSRHRCFLVWEKWPILDIQQIKNKNSLKVLPFKGPWNIQTFIATLRWLINGGYDYKFFYFFPTKSLLGPPPPFINFQGMMKYKNFFCN